MANRFSGAEGVDCGLKERQNWADNKVYSRKPFEGLKSTFL